MIGDLKSYPEYKESRLPWLGKVPLHWSLERTKWRFRYRKELNSTGAIENILSLTLRGVVRNDPDNPEGLVPKDYRTYQVFAKGDLVFKLIDLENLRTSRVGIVPENGIMSSAYVRLTSLSPTNIRYFFYQFYDLYSRGVYNQLGAGVRSTLGPSDLINLPIAIPPPAEQTSVVRFLDYANARLEQAIRAKRKVIALLNEQKQTIIHRAVTRGLDQSVSLKPSGVDWIGEIPHHWRVTRIKYLLRQVDERSTTGSEPLLSMRMHHGLVLFSEHFSRPPQAATLIGFKVVHFGQFVVNRMQAGNGLIFASKLAGLVSPDYAVLDPIGDANVEFLGELFRSRSVRAKFRAESKGLGTGSSGFLRLYSDKMGAIHVALPPREEQAAILERLASDLSDLNRAISRLEREIELLREYRTRLFADVVTGKLDVREVAARLPDEAVLKGMVKDDVELTDEEEADEVEVAA
jgi:type I restriction enzyme S subunit